MWSVFNWWEEQRACTLHTSLFVSGTKIISRWQKQYMYVVLEKLLAVTMVQFLKDCLVCVQNKNHWTKRGGGLTQMINQKGYIQNSCYYSWVCGEIRYFWLKKRYNRYKSLNMVMGNIICSVNLCVFIVKVCLINANLFLFFCFSFVISPFLLIQ